MGTMIGGAVGSVLQPNAAVFVAMEDDRETIRCPHCSLNQFFKASRKSCLRCKREMRTEPVPPPVYVRQQAPAEPQVEIGVRVCLRIKVIRELKAMPQSELAAAMGCPRTYITKVENCSLVPTLGQLQRLATGLGVSLRDLVNDDIPPDWLAYSTIHQGGTGAELMTELVTVMPKLTPHERYLLYKAARDLRRGQLSFRDWMRV